MSQEIVQLSGRVTKLEDNVTELKVETGKFSVELTAFKDVFSTSQDHLRERLESIDIKLETIADDPDMGAMAKVIQGIFTPQTVMIILAIVASAVGAPIVAQNMMGTTATAPVQAISTPAVEVKEE